jgi:PAS domain S-box-containing protein
MLWAAVRLGVGGTSLALLGFAAAIILPALEGRGPFATTSSIDDIVSLQVFLTAIAIPLLLLAALMDERRQTEQLIDRSEARMKVVAASTDTGMWQWDEATKQLWTTDYCWSMLGIDRSTPLTPGLFLDLVHPDDRGRIRAAMQAVFTTPDLKSLGEFRIRRPDGEVRWFVVRAHTEFDKVGKPIRVSGVLRDVTPYLRAREEATQLAGRLVDLQEKERQSIAEELHDSTAQHLVAVNLNLMALSGRITVTDETRNLLEEIRSSLSEATNELRTFTYLLRPPELAAEGINTALQRYVQGFERRTGVKATLRPSLHADVLPLEQQRALLRIAQESLANVHRHAGAHRVILELRCLGSWLHLVIRDDGKGLSRPPDDAAADPLRLGVGIPGMTARIRQLGGKIDIRSTSKGTTVHVAVPIDREVTLDEVSVQFA